MSCTLTRCSSAKSLPLMLCLCGISGASGCMQPSAPAFTEAQSLGGREVSAETLNSGRDLYRIHCVSCHGETGAGDGAAARSLKFPPRDFRAAAFSFVPEGQLPEHQDLVDRIRSGAPERGMPAWKGMREEDLSALADYIKTFSALWLTGSRAGQQEEKP